METIWADEFAWFKLKDALAALKEAKPNDRGEKDRAYAVTITEMEKLLAYFFFYVMMNDIERKVWMENE